MKREAEDPFLRKWSAKQAARHHFMARVGERWVTYLGVGMGGQP